MLALIHKLGENIIHCVLVTGRTGIFFSNCLTRILTPPFKLNPVIHQIHFIGVRSVYVVLVTGIFTGMVLSLQGYYSLSRFGSEELLGSAVALSLIRELGPVLTALMVIGRAGSAICAEIGIMRHAEQIDALKCMAIDPYRYLLIPKVLASVIVMPILTIFFIIIGIFGGYLVGVLMLGVNEGAYLSGMTESVGWPDIQMGLIKSFLFGLLMVIITASKGYYIHMGRNNGFGAEGVSRATTSAVVLASVTILIWDYLISSILM